jgi:hypothetical protein
MRRIRQLVDRGTTLLFVSHSTDIREAALPTWPLARRRRGRYWAMPASLVRSWYSRSSACASPTTARRQNPPARAGRDPASARRGGPDVSGEDRSHRAVDVPARKVDACRAAGLPVPQPDQRIGARSRRSAAKRPRSSSSSSVARKPAPSRSAVDGSVARARPVPTRRAADRDGRFHLVEGEHTITIAPCDAPNARRRAAVLARRPRADRAAPRVFAAIHTSAPARAMVERYGTAKARLTAVDLVDYVTGTPVRDVAYGQRVRLRLHAERLEPVGPRLEFLVHRARSKPRRSLRHDDGRRGDPSRSDRGALRGRVRLRTSSCGRAPTPSSSGRRVLGRPRPAASRWTRSTSPACSPSLRPDASVWYVYHEPVEVSGVSVYGRMTSSAIRMIPGVELRSLGRIDRGERLLRADVYVGTRLRTALTIEDGVVWRVASVCSSTTRR